MEAGNIVRLRAYGGEVLERVVAGFKGKTVLICTEAEYERAKKEAREPEAIGWPADDVLEVLMPVGSAA